MTEAEPVKSKSDALQKVLAITSKQFGRPTAYFVALLGLYSLIPASSLPPELIALAGTLGGEALGSILDRVVNEDLSKDDIIDSVQAVIKETNIDDLLRKDHFNHAFAQLRKGQRTLSNQNQIILDYVSKLGNDVVRQANLLSSEEIANIRQSFIHWTANANNEIYIPSLRVALPMAEAWSTLRTVNPDKQKDVDAQAPFEQQIQQYYDWHRLAESVEGKDIVDVEKVITNHRRIVVIGGAGAGKSTLLRRLTQIWSQQDRLVLRVPLRTLALRLDNGELFDEAIIAVASEGFASDNVKYLKVLQSATCLLADGLDETGVSRADIAKKLCLWASADSSRQVIVTTRSVGHNSAWFCDWQHCELLPLRQDDVKTFVHKIFGLLHENKELARKKKDDFLVKLKDSRTASIAARSPQLLGFLIALHCNDHPIDGNRYQLFQAIVDEMAAYKSQDRIFRNKSEKVIADFVLDRVAWRLLENSFVDLRELSREIGEQVAQDFDYPLKRGQREVERAVEFWEERGLLERISIPVKAILTFIHRGFQEFAAARYSSDMLELDFINFVKDNQSSPTFRETLLMTGATSKLLLTITTLLEGSDTSDPVATNSLLAAEVLAEAEKPPENLRKLVYESLEPRLESNIPIVAYEAAQKLLPLAHLNHEVIGIFAQQLVMSNKVWSQEIGCLLCIVAGETYVNEQVLLKIYPQLNDSGMHSIFRGDFLRSFKHQPITMQLLVEGAKYLIGRGHVNIVLDKFKEGNMSGHAHDRLQEILVQSVEPHLIRPLVSEKYLSITKYFENSQKLRKVTLNAWIKFSLEASQELLEDDVQLASLTPDASLQSIKTIYKVLEVGKSYAEDIVGLKHQLELIKEVFKGVILVTGLNPRQVKVDAEWAANIFADFSNEERLNFTLSAEEYPAPIVDWTLASNEDLNVDLLFSAVDHPSVFVRHFATLLLVNCIAQDKVQAGFSKKLYEDNPVTLRIIAHIAENLWETEAANLILERLEKDITVNCTPLVEFIGKVEFSSDDQQRLLSILRQAIEFPNGNIVEAASKSALDLGLSSQLASEIRVTYEYWLSDGPPYPQGAGTVPHNPAGELLDSLIFSKTITYEDLLKAAATTRRRDVKEKAMAEICKYLQINDGNRQQVMLDIRENKLPSEVLLILSKTYPEYCYKHTAELLSLLEIEGFKGKLICIEILGAGWANIDEVEPILRTFLDDPDANIRDEAIFSLRKLKEVRNDF